MIYLEFVQLVLVLTNQPKCQSFHVVWRFGSGLGNIRDTGLAGFHLNRDLK